MPLISTLTSRQALHITRDLALTGWHWWLAETNAMVPARLKCFFAEPGERSVLSFDGDALAGTADPNEAPAIVLLARKLVLRRRITLPIGVLPDLAAAMLFEIDRQTPFTPEQVHQRHRVLARDAKRKVVEVELAVTPRRVVDRVLAQAAARGVEINQVRVEGDDGPHPLDFLPRDRRRVTSWRREPWKPLLVVASLILVVGLEGTAYLMHARTAALAAEIAAKRDVGRQGEALRAELDSALAAQRFLPEQLAHPRAVVTLDLLSRAVPADSWVFDLEWSAKEVRLQGFSYSVPTLIEQLQKLPALGTLELRSPVQQNIQGAGDSFDIAFALREPAS